MRQKSPKRIRRAEKKNLVGTINRGWDVAKYLLTHEREMISSLFGRRGATRPLSEIAAAQIGLDDKGRLADPHLRTDIARAEIDGLWNLLKLSIGEADESGIPGVGASAVKLFFTELKQRIGDVALRVLGRAMLGRADIAELPVEYFSHEALQSLSMTIAAGSSQIQRKIIGERILGLPKEP